MVIYINNKKSNNFMGHMAFETFKNIVDQAEGNVQFLSLASRGEPLLCPDIDKMLDYTRDKFYNLKINTNAYNLNEKLAHTILKSGVKTLVFSDDAADKKLYEKLNLSKDNLTIDKFLIKYSELRHVIRRAFIIEKFPYSEIQDNTISE